MVKLNLIIRGFYKYATLLTEIIAKRYDKAYKLQGKPAAYYLTPHGARILEACKPREPDEHINIKRLYKDKDGSEGLIEHLQKHTGRLSDPQRSLL